MPFTLDPEVGAALQALMGDSPPTSLAVRSLVRTYTGAGADHLRLMMLKAGVSSFLGCSKCLTTRCPKPTMLVAKTSKPKPRTGTISFAGGTPRIIINYLDLPSFMHMGRYLRTYFVETSKDLLTRQASTDARAEEDTLLYQLTNMRRLSNATFLELACHS